MKDVDQMNGTELRAEAARLLQAGETLRKADRDRLERLAAVNARLISGDGVAMAAAEGIPTSFGTLARRKLVKGRRFPNKEKIDERAGELGDLAPSKDHRIVIEHESELPTALAAELQGLAAADEPVVVRTEKAKYPTVKQLEEAFGPDTELIGQPAAEHVVVLVREVDRDLNPAGEVLIGPEGVL